MLDSLNLFKVLQLQSVNDLSLITFLPCERKRQKERIEGRNVTRYIMVVQSSFLRSFHRFHRDRERDKGPITMGHDGRLTKEMSDGTHLASGSVSLGFYL